VSKQQRNKTETLQNKEVMLDEDEFIVSKTDTSGRVTYVNRTFMLISGYLDTDIVGKQHNLVRHPDMPRGVYRQMWTEIKAGREFFGFVKNRCKDGSFYWVFANITPDHDETGALRGYYSVRRKANPKGVAFMEPIYQTMLEEETKGDKKSAPDRSWQIVEDYLKEQNLSYNQLVLSLDE